MFERFLLPKDPAKAKRRRGARPEKPGRSRGRSAQPVWRMRPWRFLVPAVLGACLIAAAFLLDLRAGLRMFWIFLSGGAGTTARVAALACLLTVAGIVFLEVRRHLAARRPAHKRGKAPPSRIPDNWAVVGISSVAMAGAGVAAWSAVSWLGGLLLNGLTGTALLMGAASVGAVVWAVRQPTQGIPAKAVRRPRAPRAPGAPRPRRPEGAEAETVAAESQADGCRG
jgi:hypothetical protein